jgi:hypothetical protein
MGATQRMSILGLAAACCAFGADDASPEPGPLGNSFYLFTSALNVDDEGVVSVPSRFQWRVETSLRGFDLNGAALPDNLVLLRLYDPDHNFTALTAQMDLATAGELQQELAEIIAKKSADPSFQHRPQPYDPRMIPMRRLVGVDARGVAIVDDIPADEVPGPPSTE